MSVTHRLDPELGLDTESQVLKVDVGVGVYDIPTGGSGDTRRVLVFDGVVPPTARSSQVPSCSSKLRRRFP